MILSCQTWKVMLVLRLSPANSPSGAELSPRAHTTAQPLKSSVSNSILLHSAQASDADQEAELLFQANLQPVIHHSVHFYAV